MVLHFVSNCYTYINRDNYKIMVRPVITTTLTARLKPWDNCMAVIQTWLWDDTQVWEDDKIWWDDWIVWTKLTPRTPITTIIT